MKDAFRKFSARIANATGSAGAFILATMVVVVWAITGPAFNFSSNWQLVINTGTTIVTFLMVFLIQNAQNRDGKAVQLKLDELIRSSRVARDKFMGLEDLTDEDIAVINDEFKVLHEKQIVKEDSRLNKLHSKIQAENKRRVGLHQAGQVISAVGNILTLNTLNSNKDDKPTKK
jgi:low affinity Fe/Cu permease